MSRPRWAHAAPCSPAVAVWPARTFVKHHNYLWVSILFASSSGHPPGCSKAPVYSAHGRFAGALTLSLQKAPGRGPLLPRLPQKRPQAINRFLARYTWLRVHILGHFCAECVGLEIFLEISSLWEPCGALGWDQLFWVWDELSLHVFGWQSQEYRRIHCSTGWGTHVISTGFLPGFSVLLSISLWRKHRPNHSFPEPQMVQINLRSIHALIRSYQWEWILGSALNLMLSH